MSIEILKLGFILSVFALIASLYLIKETKKAGDIAFIFLLLMIFFLMLITFSPDIDFCEERGYSQVSTVGIEPGYVECIGKFVNHKYEGNHSEIFKYNG